MAILGPEEKKNYAGKKCVKYNGKFNNILALVGSNMHIKYKHCYYSGQISRQGIVITS